ncbi:hypothetical protein Dde_1455 [Oleidesulfovibrio alaskensis G20]|jgi:hypothetical protein|uniref:Uncharacterized protein n=1 Tax=Oleidesulfovibrio alaskensis (strain ATCC BAA-1058 / DSM 17464 / G20) TaxID=207559 RepID=Q311Z2_OLEA2|nr:hypothetical protein [Oleidesulfovibrio alaskensis]ABB38254.1 hypothetical protein Dde_1455 [Oleidesulfovibrio alaskensis G20]MBG0774300.1 hypothetical protein [Oleidesulfovibrio alaskensis]MBL3581193.1 hypothetical protein [Oleidesulfovibrio alaskensis]
MKITNEQLQALQQQEEARKKPRGAAAGFDSLLAGQLQGGAQGAAAQSVLPPPGAGSVNPLLMVQQTGQTEGAVPLSGVADTLGGVLDDWENYSRMIAGEGGNADLRSAYSTLEGIGEEVARIRDAVPDLAERHPGMGRIVDELEVMTVTERFKINRGDYSA